VLIAGDVVAREPGQPRECFIDLQVCTIPKANETAVACGMKIEHRFEPAFPVAEGGHRHIRRVVHVHQRAENPAP
jgi:hypothetical protein